MHDELRRTSIFIEEAIDYNQQSMIEQKIEEKMSLELMLQYIQTPKRSIDK